jgi:hypothetical protein
MHKGVILLTKASDESEAIANVNSFLEQYGDGDVWDWYIIGGRWSGTLNTKNAEFLVKAKEFLVKKYPENGVGVIFDKNIKESAGELQKIWEELGQTDMNPYTRDQYNSEGASDDCLPLTECLGVIKEWIKDMNAEADEHFQNMVKARKEEKSKKGGTMSAYYAGLYKDAKYDRFCFESNIYDIVNETNNPVKALAEPDEYFAIIVDMHN